MANHFAKEFFFQLAGRTMGDCRSVPRYASDAVAYRDKECPLCHSVRDRLMANCDGNEVLCVDCWNWFELPIG